MEDYKVIYAEISKSEYTAEIAARNIIRKIEAKRILPERIWEIFKHARCDRPSDYDICLINDYALIYPTKIALGDTDEVSESVITSIYDKYSRYEYWSKVTLILFYYSLHGEDKLANMIGNGFGYDLEISWDNAAMWLNMFFEYYHEVHKKKSVQTCAIAESNTNDTKGYIKLTEENKERLKTYFTNKFVECFFEESLIADLEQNPYSLKELTAIAAVIYDSNCKNKRNFPKTFKTWRDAFFDILGLSSTYKQNQVKTFTNYYKETLHYLK